MRLATSPRSIQCSLVSRRRSSRPSCARPSGHCVSGSAGVARPRPGCSGAGDGACWGGRVRDAQGQPVDGLPVVFSAEPSWTQNVSFTPVEARTCHGQARTIFEANTTGVVHMMARVDHVRRGARMTIPSHPSPGGGGASRVISFTEEDPP
jgi:hypothetical protein